MRASKRSNVPMECYPFVSLVSVSELIIRITKEFPIRFPTLNPYQSRIVLTPRPSAMFDDHTECFKLELWYDGPIGNPPHPSPIQPNTTENCVVCCSFCNYIKGDLLTYEEMLTLGPALQKIHESRRVLLPANSINFSPTSSLTIR